MPGWVDGYGAHLAVLIPFLKLPISKILNVFRKDGEWVEGHEYLWDEED